MTTARHCAIEAWDLLTQAVSVSAIHGDEPTDVEARCRLRNRLDVFRDYVLSAAEGRTQKTSGGYTANPGPTEPVANSKAASAPVPTTPARGPEEAGIDSDALKLAREVMGGPPSLDSGQVSYWIGRARRLAREVVSLYEEREEASGALLVNIDEMPPGSTLGKVVSANSLLRQENARLLARAAAAERRASPASSSAPAEGRPDREALGRAAYEAKCFAEGNAAIPYGWKPVELGQVWEQWRVVGERLYEMGRKDGEALNDERYRLFKGMQARAEAAEARVLVLEAALRVIRESATPPRQFAVYGLDVSERHQERMHRCEEIVRICTENLRPAAPTADDGDEKEKT